MKRLFLILLSFLMLTACGKQELPVETEQTLPVPAVTKPVPEISEPEEAEGEPIEDPISVSYDVESVEGLVEDAVGYIFEVPTFGVPAADTIRAYYSDMANYLIDFTKEAVYPTAAELGCIANVTGTVTSAELVGSELTVDYLFRCDFSGSEEDQENPRTDVFDAFSGELVG